MPVKFMTIRKAGLGEEYRKVFTRFNWKRYYRIK